MTAGGLLSVETGLSPCGAADVVEARGLGKRFDIGASPRGPLPRRAAGLLFGLRARRPVWAVRGVDIRVRRGECLGIIGLNGAGKTTLLSLLAGLLRPTEGEIAFRGRAVPLLQVGSGLHPELTVLDNLRLACALFGMSREQWFRRRDAVVAFGGLEDYLCARLEELSLGFQSRVPFSAALHCDMDVLLADEALSVGDAVFARKCLARVGALIDSGVGAVLASHDVGMILDHCSRAVFLEGGSVRAEGPSEPVVSAYLSRCGLRSA